MVTGSLAAVLPKDIDNFYILFDRAERCLAFAVLGVERRLCYLAEV
jgi:hypothetical protein